MREIFGRTFVFSLKCTVDASDPYNFYTCMVERSREEWEPKGFDAVSRNNPNLLFYILPKEESEVELCEGLLSIDRDVPHADESHGPIVIRCVISSAGEI